MFGQLHLMNVDDSSVFSQFIELTIDTPSVTVDIPTGRYSADFTSFDVTGGELALVSVDRPEFEVSGPAEVVLDSNEAVQMSIDVGEPTVNDGVEMLSSRSDALGVRTVGWLFGSSGTPTQAYALPTAPVSVGEYEYYSRWYEDPTSGDASYDLLFPSRKRSPRTCPTPSRKMISRW